MWLYHMCDVTHSYTWLNSLICVNDSLICVNDSLICVNNSLICVYDSLICVTWRVHGYHVTQSYVWRDSRIRVTRLTYTGWRRPIACLELRVSFRKRATNYRAQPLIIWLFCGKWPMKIGHPICLGHPVCGTWLVHGFHVTAWYVWCDSLVRVTRLTHACQWLTYMCQRLTHRCVWLTRMCDVTHSYV